MAHLLILLDTIQKETVTNIRNDNEKRTFDLLRAQPPFSTDIYSISAKLNQIVWFIILSLLLYRGFKICSMPIEKFKSEL